MPQLLLFYVHAAFHTSHLPPFPIREDQAFGVHRGVGSYDFNEGSFGAFQVGSSVVLDFGSSGDRRDSRGRRNQAFVPIPFAPN